MRAGEGIAIAAWAMLACGAAAQGLKLGEGRREPTPGEGRAALTLAELLGAEADESPDIGGAGRALRRLAAALLRGGEMAGQPGSEAVLAGLTLAARRGEIDAQLAGAGPAVAGYVESQAEIAPQPNAAREIDLLLRDALAPLAEDDAPGCAWWREGAGEPGARLAEQLAVLRREAGSRWLREDAGAALGEMVATLELAPEHPAFLPSALEWGELIETALGALGEPPEWLGMPARDRMREGVSSGLALCLTEPERARTILRLTATHVRIVRAARLLEGPAQTRELREAVNRLVSAPEHDALRDPQSLARIGATFERALALLGADSRVPAPGTLVRQVRPMLAPLAAAHGRAGEALARVLPTILTSPDPMTEPGVAAAVASCTRTAADLEMPERISRTLAWWPEGSTGPLPAPGGEPRAVGAVAPVAEQVRALAAALADEGESLGALGQLREIDGVAAALLEMPGERHVRGTDVPTAWRLVTGGQEARLAFVIDEARRAWARAYSSEPFAGDRAAATQRVRDLTGAMRTLSRGVAAEGVRLDWSRRVAPALNAWAAWELGTPGAEAITEGLRPRLSALASTIARGDAHAEAAEMAREIRREYSAALLLGELETLAGERDLSRCSAASELAFGPPAADAWLIGWRRELAQVCRSAYEAGAAEGGARAGFLSHANRVALAMLDSLGP